MRDNQNVTEAINSDFSYKNDQRRMGITKINVCCLNKYRGIHKGKKHVVRMKPKLIQPIRTNRPYKVLFYPNQLGDTYATTKIIYILILTYAFNTVSMV